MNLLTIVFLAAAIFGSVWLLRPKEPGIVKHVFLSSKTSDSNFFAIYICIIELILFRFSKFKSSRSN